jgi:hypothetical protein
MDGDDGRNRLKTFLLGGIVGASAVLAAARRRTTPVPQAEPVPPRGLSAFEDAPCFHELAARDESGKRR